MLKSIVKFLKAQLQVRQDTTDLFARRFSEGYTDRDQWNGGRHVNIKELEKLSMKSGR